MDYKRLVIEPVERIGNVIPKNRVTLVTGLPGTGKSYSIGKFLNENDIKPIYFNLDATEIGDLKVDMFGGEALVELAMKYNDFKDLKDKTIVIDTYARFEELMSAHLDTSALVEGRVVQLFENITKKYKCTLIVIGHTEDYVAKDSVFNANKALSRNTYEHLHFSRK